MILNNPSVVVCTIFVNQAFSLHYTTLQCTKECVCLKPSLILNVYVYQENTVLITFIKQPFREDKTNHVPVISSFDYVMIH